MPFRANELEAYLDEALPVEEMARIEKALRDDPALAGQITAILGRRDSGVYSLGEIWRRHRLSCPSRPELGSFVLGVLDEGPAAYVRFHVDVIGCRFCQANLADLESQRAEGAAEVQSRQRRYFQTSAGYLRAK